MGIALPTLSPCAAVLPVFIKAGLENSFSFYVYLYLLLAVTTSTVMMVMVSLAFTGASKLKFKTLEKHEKLIIGSLLFSLGMTTWLFHDQLHSHGHEHHEHHGHYHEGSF